MQTFISRSTQQTEDYAAQIAAKLSAGAVIACRAPMGAGKTAFARGLARGLGLSDEVSSPTFALVQEYTHGKIPMYHFDMYRVHGFDELYSTGFFDYLDASAVLYVEWSENIRQTLPENIYELSIETIDENTRKITIEGAGF